MEEYKPIRNESWKSLDTRLVAVLARFQAQDRDGLGGWLYRFSIYKDSPHSREVRVTSRFYLVVGIA